MLRRWIVRRMKPYVRGVRHSARYTGNPNVAAYGLAREVSGNERRPTALVNLRAYA